MSFHIGERQIGLDYPTYVIAELSCNHNGNLNEAIALVDIAAEAGADCVKLQTYKPETISRDFGDLNSKVNGTEWNGYSVFDLYKKAHTPWDWYHKIAEQAQTHGMDIISSPFDETAVDFLVEQNAPCLKVSSFEVIDLKLLEKMAKTGLPIIMSNGMTTPDELTQAVSTLRENGCLNLSLLHCNSGYPALFQEANLKTIPVLSEVFSDDKGPLTVGLSDHTLWADPDTREMPMGHITPTESVRFGARIIEVHLISSRSASQDLMKSKKGGFDWAFSREGHELKQMINCIRAVENDPEWQYESQAERDLAPLTHGKIWMWPTSNEWASRKVRPSLYITEDVKKGERLIFQGGPNNKGNFDSIRPNDGLNIKYTDIINGAMSAKDIKRGEPLKWEHVIKK